MTKERSEKEEMVPKTQVKVYLSPELALRLKSESEKKGLNISEFTEKALMQYITLMCD